MRNLVRDRTVRVELRLAPSQQQMWAALRERGSLRTNELSERRDDIVATRKYLSRLVKAGIADRLPMQPGDPLAVCLVKDMGPIAPALTDGGHVSRRGLGTAQMWRTIRMHGQVSVRDLSIWASTMVAPVTPKVAGRYLWALHCAGYLQQLAVGGSHSPAQYRLIPSKNTGPLPPRVIGICAVYDDNLHQLVHAEEVRDAG